jgi:hypothetical protein
MTFRDGRPGLLPEPVGPGHCATPPYPFGYTTRTWRSNRARPLTPWRGCDTLGPASSRSFSRRAPRTNAGRWEAHHMRSIRAATTSGCSSVCRLRGRLVARRPRARNCRRGRVPRARRVSRQTLTLRRTLDQGNLKLRRLPSPRVENRCSHAGARANPIDVSCSRDLRAAPGTQAGTPGPESLSWTDVGVGSSPAHPAHESRSRLESGCHLVCRSGRLRWDFEARGHGSSS